MDLNECRARIDEIDGELTRLFIERMNVSAELAAFKRQKGLPISDPQREREKRAKIAEEAGPALATYTDSLYSLIFELSRTYQRKLSASDSELKRKILRALAETEKEFPARPTVAVQGVEGAYSQLAAESFSKRQTWFMCAPSRECFPQSSRAFAAMAFCHSKTVRPAL
jgi:chorismate mutase/prephenate dehydratase